MKPKSALQRRIAPAAPLALEFEDAGELRRLDLRLVFDFNAVALVEETLHINLLSGEILDPARLTGTALSVMFWASLQAYHPEYEGAEGLVAVRSLMDLPNAPKISLAVVESLKLTVARPTAPAPATAEAGNGASSGRLHATTSDLVTPNSAV
jgi:hypothetical protein